MAILDYVASFPAAADTPSGILASWLPPRGFEWAAERISRVLEDMVADRLLDTRSLPDGRTLYVRRGG